MTAPQSQKHPAGQNGKGPVIGVCVLLVVAVFVVFGETARYEFVDYDDGSYVYENTHVTKGLTLTGMVWAFTTSSFAYWHPVTWLSHMLDCQLWGLNAGGHHLTNVLIHAANAVLLFLVLRQMMRFRAEASSPTVGVLWPCAFVAAVFAIHPLDVETVAWVAERKSVLSALFWLLTMGAYLRYVRQPGWARYMVVIVCYALGLMSKPMLVTLPFVLLLLDYWPLERVAGDGWRGARVRHLVVEKVPLLMLAGISSVVTYVGQEHLGAVTTLEYSPLLVRLAKVPINYATYLRDIFWPEGLAVPYPYSSAVSMYLVVLCVLLLAGITVLVVWGMRSRPYLAVGWFWFLGTLVPVIGLIQVGSTPVADRFTYLSQIGIYLLVVWAIRDLSVSWRWRCQVLGAGASIVVVVLMLCAWRQTTYWRNDESLWGRALACTSGNHLAHDYLAYWLAAQGRPAEAIKHYQMALEINPDYSDANYNLGTVFLKQGRMDEAMALFQKTIQLKPDFADAHNNLANILAKKGQIAEAVAQYRKAIDLKPDYAEPHYNLGVIFGVQGQLDEAVEQYRSAIKIKPDYADAHGNLANVLAAQGKLAEAIKEYQRTLGLVPDSAQAHFRYGQALQAQRDFKAAITEYQRTIELNPRHV
ncbi:MAG: tetratricopeptide repeat protein, partial [Verrucomicrobiota bacterium]